MNASQRRDCWRGYRLLADGQPSTAGLAGRFLDSGNGWQLQRRVPRTECLQRLSRLCGAVVQLCSCGKAYCGRNACCGGEACCAGRAGQRLSRCGGGGHRRRATSGAAPHSCHPESLRGLQGNAGWESRRNGSALGEFIARTDDLLCRLVVQPCAGKGTAVRLSRLSRSRGGGHRRGGTSDSPLDIHLPGSFRGLQANAGWENLRDGSDSREFIARPDDLLFAVRKLNDGPFGLAWYHDHAGEAYPRRITAGSHRCGAGQRQPHGDQAGDTAGVAEDGRGHGVGIK